jgi:hypothetical protein
MSSALIDALSSFDVDTLIRLITSNPTWESVNQLAYGFCDVAQSQPGDVDKIASAILSIRSAPDLPDIDSTDSTGQPVKAEFADELTRCLLDMLKHAFGGRHDLTVHPKNTFLVAAMISGACVRTGLCDSGVQAGEISCGLHFRDSEYESYLAPKDYEINILHACLQLLVGGSTMHIKGEISHYKAEWLPALTSMSRKGYVKDPNGKKLLEVTIAQTKAGFPNDLSASDVWSTLFPDT